MEIHQKKDKKPSFGQRITSPFKRVPSSVWVIVMLLLNIVACWALLRTCNEASGRRVDESLFAPSDELLEQEEEKKIEEEVKKKDKETEATTDTIRMPVFDEINNGDPTQTGETTPPVEEEVFNADEYDGVEVDETPQEILPEQP